MKGYTQEQTITYYQVDQKGRLSPAALLAALQNVAIAHADALGYTLEEVEKRQCGWVVIHWHIAIVRMPKHLEQMRLETWCSKCRGMQAERCYHVYDENGEILAKAMSRWVYMDFVKRKPTTVPQEMIEAYGNKQPPAIEGEKFDMPRQKEGDVVGSQDFVVTRRDTDTNRHVNNVKYLEWALDDVPDEIYDYMTLRDIRMLYRKECRRGESVHTQTIVQSHPMGKQSITRIEHAAGDVLAEAVLIWEK